MNYDADVIVIGAGGGGAVVAKELGEKGLKVLVLEAGPWYGNKKWPYPNSEPGATSCSTYENLSIDLLKQSFTDLEDDMNDYITGKFRWGPANRERSPWPRDILQRGFAWQNAGVGGSTLHYLGNCPRAYPEAINNIWPISYEELIPYYEKVEVDLPIHPAPVTAKEDLFYYGARRAGWSRIDSPDVTTPGFRPQPNAILRPNPLMSDPNFEFEGNSSIGCTLRGHCINGCHIGPTVEGVAKRSTLVSYIPGALRTNNVTVRPNTFVTRVLTATNNDKGLHATGITYRDTWTGEIGELYAKVVVMAAGAIETPRLWLNSELPRNDWVGKGLINHWFDCVSGIFDERDLLKILGTTDIRPYVGQNSSARFDYPGLGAMQVYGMSPGLFSSIIYLISDVGYSNLRTQNPDAPWDIEGAVVGEQLKEFMREYSRTMAVLISTDDEINQRNGVTLDPNIKDEHGYIPVIRYQPSKQDIIKRDKLARITADILRQAGAKMIIRTNWPADIFIHILGTMRIGEVTDTNCEAKQVKRLYIADNSVLYNALGGPNPTLTTQALAVRTSDKIINQYFD